MWLEWPGQVGSISRLHRRFQWAVVFSISSYATCSKDLAKGPNGGSQWGLCGLLYRQVAPGPPRELALECTGDLRRVSAASLACPRSAKASRNSVGPSTGLGTIGGITAFPGQPTVGDHGSGQGQLDVVGHQDQPSSQVGLLGVTHTQGSSSQGLLQAPYGVFQIESATVGAPE